MSNKTDFSYSFWQLISRYRIEIPLIQRDYAQGRKAPKAADVRKQLIENMLGALTNSDKSLTFDFVYGRVSDGTFIPIDGQQRLTTLFLFHVYLFKCCREHAQACGNENGVPLKNALAKFTYATRQSSREFCKKLVEEEIIPPQGTVEDLVKDQSWFYPDWASDPTVDGMLRTLDEIHSQLQEKQKKEPLDVPLMLETLLSDNCPITFQFLDMGEHGLTDDLYLKMNARGLSLTAWENFKASLEKYLGGHQDKVKAITNTLRPKNESDTPTWEKLSNEKRIAWKLEHDWHDLFWDTKAPDPVETERQMLKMFHCHFLNVWRLEHDDDATSQALAQPVNGETFTPFSVYENVLEKCGIHVALNPIVNLFEALVHHGKEIIETKPSWKEEPWSWSPVKKDEKYESFASRVRFYAVMKCFSQPIGNKDEFRSKYEKWMRVVWNILENTMTDEENYFSARNLIGELGDHWDGILEWLANDSEIKSKLAKAQVEEEVEKAKKISEFKEIILRAEGNPTFKGAIRFLYRNEKGKSTWSDFAKKSERAGDFFSKNGLISSERVRWIEAFIKRLPSLNGVALFVESAEKWKKILIGEDENIMCALHDLLMSTNLSAIQMRDNNSKEFDDIKGQLLDVDVIEKLVNFVEPTACFNYYNKRIFRLNKKGSRKETHVIFDDGKSIRSATLKQFLVDWPRLKVTNQKLSDRLWVGEEIEVDVMEKDGIGKEAQNHGWSPKWWYDTEGNNRPCLYFEKSVYDVLRIIDVTLGDKKYNVQVCWRGHKLEENCPWLKSVKDSFTLKVNKNGNRYETGWKEQKEIEEILCRLFAFEKEDK